MKNVHPVIMSFAAASDVAQDRRDPERCCNVICKRVIWRVLHTKVSLVLALLWRHAYTCCTTGRHISVLGAKRLLNCPCQVFLRVVTNTFLPPIYLTKTSVIP